MDFFILGNPRSGTTLLRLMLNNHSLIGVPPESGFLQWWYKKYFNWSENDTNNDTKFNLFLDDILSSKKIEDWKLNRPNLKDFILSEKPKNYPEIITTIYKFYTNNKSIIGDKNNYYINHLEELNLIFPNVKYIHLVRDGRDVACSYKNINKLNPNLKYIPKVSSDIVAIANEWNNNIITIENFIQNHNSITIRYEDLISKPVEILKKICNFLDVEYEEEMLNYHQNNDEPLSTLHWKGKTKETIDEKNKKKYLSLLYSEEISKFNEIAYNTLKKFKYD
ncbi:MAG: sulfotransferase [Vicingaceae bacterium]|nr:sulfotransferase [Vicingaceae bacterium]